MDARLPRPLHPWTERFRDRQLAVRADWARRKPMLLLRLSALFLFRLDVRKFSGLLL
jgi:hypothetical protein